MIDPINITNFNQTTEELEEFLLFWVCAAGKNAKSAARALERFLISIHDKNYKKFQPFLAIRKIPFKRLPSLMKEAGIGCFNQKAKTFWNLANSKLNLKRCNTEELEEIYGIGMKTSRCFLIHSRKDVSCAGLDVHILKFLSDSGYDVPKQTPPKKTYLKIEKIFLELVKQSNKTVAEYDLDLWRTYSGNKNV